MAYVQIGSGGGNGPLISDYGLMRIRGDIATIRFWDGWPEEEIKFDHTDATATAAALAHCRELAAGVEAKWRAAQAEWRAQPWWRKLFRRKPR